MRLKKWALCIAAAVTVFSFCSEDGKGNPSVNTTGSEFNGNWKAQSMRTRTFDTAGELISDTIVDLEVTPLYYHKDDNDFTRYTITDSCVTTDGPNLYTMDDNRVYYTWMGVLEMEDVLELDGDNLLMESEIDMYDSEGVNIISIMELRTVFKKYDGTLPLSSWPEDECPPMF